MDRLLRSMDLDEMYLALQVQDEFGEQDMQVYVFAFADSISQLLRTTPESERRPPVSDTPIKSEADYGVQTTPRIDRADEPIATYDEDEELEEDEEEGEEGVQDVAVQSSTDAPLPAPQISPPPTSDEVEEFVASNMNRLGWDSDPSLTLAERLEATRDDIVGWRWDFSNVAIYSEVGETYGLELEDDELDTVSTGMQLVSLIIGKLRSSTE